MACCNLAGLSVELAMETALFLEINAKCVLQRITTTEGKTVNSTQYAL